MFYCLFPWLPGCSKLPMEKILAFPLNLNARAVSIVIWNMESQNHTLYWKYRFAEAVCAFIILFLNQKRPFCLSYSHCLWWSPFFEIMCRRPFTNADTRSNAPSQAKILFKDHTCRKQRYKWKTNDFLSQARFC